jgi:hypothetical protein
LEPFAGLHNGVVRAVQELLFDFFQLGSHPLAHRLAFHHKTPVPFLPADRREAQEIERVWLTSSLLSPVALGVEAKLNPARFIWVQFQPELSEPFLQIHQETVGIRPMLETEYRVVGLAHDQHITSRALLAPGLYPQVEYIMQIDVAEQR